MTVAGSIGTSLKLEAMATIMGRSKAGSNTFIPPATFT